MNQDLKNRIRERAYEIWITQGRLDGQADQHWLAAEREVLAPQQPKAQKTQRAKIRSKPQARPGKSRTSAMLAS